jgi:hypothetical protein
MQSLLRWCTFVSAILIFHSLLAHTQQPRQMLARHVRPAVSSGLAQDYQAVVEFARAQGFTVNGSPANCLVVPISGIVDQIQNAFNVSMKVYRHPIESRTFFSPDREPSIPSNLHVSHIAGLDNFSIPQATVRRPQTNGSMSASVRGFASPRWAGYLALVNPQAAEQGESSVGFLDPLLYSIGTSSAYDGAFHDTTSGNNNYYGVEPYYNAYVGSQPVGFVQAPIFLWILVTLTLPFSLATASTPVSLSAGGSASTSISIAPQNGYAGTVALSATWLPKGMTATFDSNPTAGDCDLTISADSSVPAGTYFVNVAGTGGGQTLTRTTTLQVGAPASTATPTFSLGTGIFTTLFTVSISDSTPGAVIYYTTDGSAPTTGSFVYSAPISVSTSETLQAIATGYATSPIASAPYTIAPPVTIVPVIVSLSPAFISAGGASFTLTVTGSGFTSRAVVYWGTTALSTQFVSAAQVTAQVPAADIASAGATAVSVQSPAPAAVASNALEFEIDSASGSGSSPDFAISTATVSPGSTATYPVTLSASATEVSVTCLNLPAGAICSYSSATGAVTIATTAATPPGTCTVTAVFAQTLRGAVSALLLFPFLLPPLAGMRRKRSVKMVYLLASLSVALMAGSAIGCVSGGHSPVAPSTPNPTHQVTSSGSVSITVQ